MADFSIPQGCAHAEVSAPSPDFKVNELWVVNKNYHSLIYSLCLYFQCLYIYIYICIYHSFWSFLCGKTGNLGRDDRVPWTNLNLTHLNLVNNICFVQLSLHPKSNAERIPLILGVLFVHFEWSKGFWIVAGLAVVWTVWSGVLPWCAACWVQTPVLGTLQGGQGQGWMDHPGCTILLIFWELAAWDLGLCCRAKAQVLSGDVMQLCKCRHLMSFICCGVRAVKPRRAGLQLLPQHGWVFCSSQGLSVSPVQMSPDTSGQVKWH